MTDLPAAICTALAHRHREFPRDRSRIEAAITEIGAEGRFGRDRDGLLVFRPSVEEQRAVRGAASNPRIKSIDLSDEQRRLIGIGITSPEGQREHAACEAAHRRAA